MRGLLDRAVGHATRESSGLAARHADWYQRTTRFAVVDTETTGLGRYDRVVEFACVLMEGRRVIGEYVTLIQPNRDVGRTDIHGVTPTMVRSAPTFEAVAGDISALLDGSVLVAHNASFDARMLAQEFARMEAEFDSGIPVCTMKLMAQVTGIGRMKLQLAAELEGLSQPGHDALGDARVATELFRCHFRPAVYRGRFRLASTRMRTSGPPAASPLTREDAKLQAKSSTRLRQVSPHAKPEARNASLELSAGMTVCFTGTCVVNGERLTRTVMEDIARGRDLMPVKSVTKKGCHLLVAADVDSRSGKARNAAKWGIPIISSEEFLSRSK